MYKYRVYMSESIRLSTQGQYLANTYMETLEMKRDTRSGDEIARDVIAKYGLKVEEE